MGDEVAVDVVGEATEALGELLDGRPVAEVLGEVIDEVVASVKAGDMPDGLEAAIRERVPGNVADDLVVRLVEGFVDVGVEELGKLLKREIAARFAAA